MDQASISRRSVLAAAGAVGLLGLTATQAQAAPTPWYPSAKFGIFIHWGAYSAAAWGDAKHAAEWYLYAMNVTDPARGTGTRDHHLKTTVRTSRTTSSSRASPPAATIRSPGCACSNKPEPGISC
ncbi:alpha-L-fucosidase [Amycolatopsis circi]|uniref:alpha-L-fucosidase n=1 Tax=Amycolatopsis circi TaxID=871959 RepID=UPI000E21EEC9